jgi:hypothetical protein
MRVYQFTLILPEVDDETASAIYGRCNDSSLGKDAGTTYLAFDREAASLESAIDSALADLRSLGVQPLQIQMEVPATSS